MDHKSAEMYLNTIECILIDNEKFDNGTYCKELDNFYDKFFTQGWDDNTPIIDMVLKENKTWEQFASEETKYLEAKGVIIVVNNNKEKN